MPKRFTLPFGFPEQIAMKMNRVSQSHVSVYVPWSKVAILGMVIPPVIGILVLGTM